MARPKTGTRKREPVYLRVVKGGFEPASALYAGMLRSKKFKVGDLVRAEITKPRNMKHHRLVFALLQRVLDNLDGAMTIEALLDIMKIKSGRVTTLIDSATGKVFYTPESIAFDAMDEGEFSILHRDWCRIIARDYLPGMTPEQVAAIADMIEEA